MDPANIATLREHLWGLLHWAHDEPVGLEVVLGRQVCVADLDENGVPREDLQPYAAAIRAAAERLVMSGQDAGSMLRLSQPRRSATDLVQDLSDAIASLDLLLIAEGAKSSNRPKESTDDAKELNGTQTVLLGALHGEYQSAAELAAATQLSEPQVRRELPNLKRMGYVEHSRGQGYRRRA